MKKSCIQCQSVFQVAPEDLKFYDTVSPIFNGKKYAIPEPDLCPDCRQQRRLAFCNERNLYPDTCNMCKKRILSEHPPELNQTSYCRDCWISDKWDVRDYGQDFDFSRPFFEQFHELMRRTPMLALNQTGTMQNSDYVHYAGFSKNCYLIAHADFCEDCMYGYGFKQNRSCIDGFYNLHDELCYDCVDVHKSYGLTACQDCQNCHSSAFLRDCIGCKNCFLCVGLREKEYCFENQQLTRADYEKKLAEIDLGSHQQYLKYFAKRQELEKAHHFKEFQGHNLQNCFGNYLYNCKDCYYCFDCEDTEESRYCTQLVLGSKNNMDVYQYGTGLQQSLDSSITGDNSYRILFSHQVLLECSDISYCAHAYSCRNCFGSTSINHNQYLIFNKQYSEKEYNELVPKIIEHMIKTGEFGQHFPPQFSFFGYNKTSAQMYYPLTKEETQKRGYKWDDYEPPIPDISKKIAAKDLPANIKDVTDDILNTAIECESTGRLFKIMPMELEFYRKQKLPLPRRSPEQRHLDRFALRNPRKFWQRQCDKCKKSLITTHSPDKNRTVYCDDCYTKELY
jgi:hypothetical protein